MAIRVKKTRNGIYQQPVERTNGKHSAEKSARRRSDTASQPVRVRLSEDEIQQRIRDRAYQIYESRSCTHGSDAQDWYEAEQQIRRETNS